MTTDLEAAVARLKRDLDAIAAETSGAKEARGDVRLLLADWERRGAREPTKEELLAELGNRQEAFLGGTIRRCRLCGDPVFGGPTLCVRDTYREERDAARAEVERLTKLNEDLLTYQELGGTCAYCKATHLKEEMPAHIEQCAKHPMAAMKAELARLRERDALVRAVLGNPGIDRQTAINRALALLKETP